MKVSTKGRYGLRALVDIALNEEGGPVSLIQTAQRQHISLNYLEQVFSILKKAGIVASVKGAGGGYRLARDMDEITVREVFEVLEGRFSITDHDSRQLDILGKTVKNLVWDEIDKRVNMLLEGKTLGHLVRESRCRERGSALFLTDEKSQK